MDVLVLQHSRVYSIQHRFARKESLVIRIPKPNCNHPKFCKTKTLSPLLLNLQKKVIFIWHMQHGLYNIATDLKVRQCGSRERNSHEIAPKKSCEQNRAANSNSSWASKDVSFKAISEALTATKVDESIAKLIFNMVLHRYVTIDHKIFRKCMRIRRGCPQGGTLSPFLWDLVVNCLTAIRHITTHNMVELRRIAAHSALWGNKRTDEN